MKTKNVFVLVDSDLNDCGASVFHNLDDLYKAVEEDYSLDESAMDELKMNCKVELGESNLYVISTTLN